MNDILSQAEIDKLLNSLISGETDNEINDGNDSVKPYDFKTANRFTKEQIRAFNMIFKNFGQLLSNYLMGMLRSDCDAEVVSIEEMSFYEFNNSVPSPAIISVINANPLPDPILLVMSQEVSYAIINRVLGGTMGIAAQGRQFTEIELAIVERVLWQILKLLDEVWSKMMDIKSSLDKMETSMQFVQIVDNNEAVLMVTMNITIGDENGILGFCLPHQALEPFMKSLDTRLVYAGKANKQASFQPEIMNTIINTEIELSCVFNSTEAPVKDIISLREGDVIQLCHRVDEPLILKYQEIPKCLVSVGKLKNNVAVKIVDAIRGDEDIE